MCGSVTVSCGELLMQLLVYGLSNGAVLALNAIGITVVYGTVRTLNLAHGDVFALTSVLVVTLLLGLGAEPDWPPLQLAGALALALAVAVLFGALLNVAIEQIAFKPFRGRSRLAPLIATLGISFILYQAALVWRTTLPSWVPGDHRSVPGLPEVPIDRVPDLLPAVDLVRAMGLPIKVNLQFGNLFVLVVAVVYALGVSWFLYRTHTGRAIRACAQNPQLAQLCGVNLDGAIWRAFAFGGGLAGAAAFIFVLYYARPFGSHGAQSGLLAFTAAILGGIGNSMGALMSGLVLGASAALSDYFFAAQWTPVLSQLLLIGLLMFRPAGLVADEGDDQADSGVGRDAIILTAPGQRTRFGEWSWWILIGVLLALPLVASLPWQILLTSIAIFALLALGLNIQLGLAGMLDLGYAVSFGLGGYLTAMLTSRWIGLGRFLAQSMDFLLVLCLTVLATGLFGALKGQLGLRLRSDYWAVVTLALGLLAPQVIINLHDLTGGVGGLPALPPPRILGFTITNPTLHYYLVAGMVILIAAASRQLIRSRTGRAWLASSEDETAAAGSGVDVGRYRTLALALSSAVAGMAGALYASTFAYVSPAQVDFHLSTMVLAMVILGGAGSVPGAIIGAAIIAGYDRSIIPWLGKLLAGLLPGNLHIGSAPDVRGLSYFNFGLALYLTVLLRSRRRN